MIKTKPSKPLLRQTSSAIRSLLTLEVATSIGGKISDESGDDFERENLINKVKATKTKF